MKIDKILPEALSGVAYARKQAITLVMGMTGSGKSTTINYLLGHSMKKIRGGRAAPVVPNPPAKMSNDAESVTLYPTTYPGTDGIVYCDCPSFSDSRGDDVTICSAIATEMTIKSAASISAVLVIIDYPLIKNQYGEGLKNLFITIGSIIKDFSKSADSLLFLLTKFPPEYDKEALKEDIEEIFNTEQKKLDKFVKTLQEEDGDDDIKTIHAKKEQAHYFYRMLAILQIIRKNFITNTFLINVFDKGQSREEIVKRIKELKPINQQKFDLNQYNSSRIQFNQSIANTITEALSLIAKKKELSTAIERYEAESKDHRARISFYKDQQLRIEYAQKSQEIQRPILITNLKLNIRNIIQTQVKWEEDLKSLNREIKEISREILDIDLSTTELYWSKVVSKDNSGLSDLVDLGVDSLGLEPITSLAVTSAISIGKFLYNLLDDGEVIYYQGLPFARLERQCENGRFANEYSFPNKGEYSILYKGDSFGKKEAFVKIFVEKKLIHKDRIGYLKRISQNKLKIFREIEESLKKLRHEQETLTSTLTQLEGNSSLSLSIIAKNDFETQIQAIKEYVEYNYTRCKEIRNELSQITSILAEDMLLFTTIKDILSIVDIPTINPFQKKEFMLSEFSSLNDFVKKEAVLMPKEEKENASSYYSSTAGRLHPSAISQMLIGQRRPTLESKYNMTKPLELIKRARLLDTQNNYSLEISDFEKEHEEQGTLSIKQKMQLETLVAQLESLKSQVRHSS